MFFSKFNINELYKEKWFVERLSTNRFVYSLRRREIGVFIFDKNFIRNIGLLSCIISERINTSYIGGKTMDNGASSYRRFLNGDESAFDDIMKELFNNLVFITLNEKMKCIRIQQSVFRMLVTNMMKNILKIKFW